MRIFDKSDAGLLAILAALIAFTPIAAAQPVAEPAEPAGPQGGTPLPADLGALLREAEANSPAILAAAARLEAASRVPSQAQAPPDPVASVGYTNDTLSGFTLGDSEFSVLSLTWTQEVPYPGKRRGAADVATQGAAKTGKDLERVRREVAAAVKSAYGDLYRLDRTAAVLQESRSVLESFAQAARRRYEVGEGAQESILKAQTEVLRLEAQLARVAQDRRASELQLNAAVGRVADTPIGVAEVLPEAALPGDPAALSEAAAAASPEIGGLEATVRQAEATLQVARLNLKPDFVWSASYGYRGELDPMVTGTFGLRIPAHRDRKQAQALLQAESELAAARQDLAARQVRIRAEIRSLISRVERAERLVILLGQGVIPQAKRTLDSAQASYSVGRVGLLDLLTDLTVVLSSRIEHVAQEAERFQALAALEPLLGGELIRVQGAPADGSAAGAGPSGGDHE